MSLTLACPMNLKLYPLDRQKCSLKVASCEYQNEIYKDNVVRRAKVSLNMIWFDGVDLVVALEIFVSIKIVTIVTSKSNT